MSRVLLTICERCEQTRSSTGEALYEAVRRLRRERGLKPLFKVQQTHCLKCCDQPCALELSGNKRSTYTRVDVTINDAAAVVDAAVLYAALKPGEELSERQLPGDSD